MSELSVCVQLVFTQQYLVEKVKQDSVKLDTQFQDEEEKFIVSLGR